MITRQKILDILFTSRRRARVRGLACALLGLVSSTALAQSSTPQKVQDLAYGDALFYFYSEDYFASATRLLVAQQQNTLPNHADDASLLLGGLYLSYGRQNDAEEIFSRLLDTTDPKVRDRAWLYLAEIAWQRGNDESARQALASMGDDLDDEFIARRQLLTARLAIDSQNFANAIETLEHWQGGDELSAYAKFNLGVALIRHGEVEQGTGFLKQVGAGDFKGLGKSRWRLPQIFNFWSARNRDGDVAPDELQAMRDKANLALGFAYLQQDQGTLAIEHLEQVSRHSALSSKAKLAAGWAASEMGDYETALKHWEGLSKNDRLDPAVQEALLAVPFARYGLGDDSKALSGYQQAIVQFETEIDHLNSFGNSLDQGEFLRALLADDDAGTVGWFWKLQHIPDTVESRYLYHLVADHAFQEGLKNYRDLVFLKDNLVQWKSSVAAYQNMLDARETRYRKRVLEQRENKTKQRLQQIQERVSVARQELQRIENDQDALALAPLSEQRNWNTLIAMETRLLSDDTQQTAAAKDKNRLLKGVMLWDLQQHYAPRLWDKKKALRNLEEQLEKGNQMSADFAAAQTFVPQRFAGFEQRIAAVNPRIDQLLTRIDHALNGHQNYLADLAGEQIEQHKTRLVAYLAEAQFALANSYDRAAQNRSTP